MTNDGLTDIEKAWLVGIDALLLHGSPQSHAVTAGRLVDLWGAGGAEFQKELARRANIWSKRHMQVLQMAGDGTGPCSQLMQLMGNPTTVHLKPSKPPAPRRPRPKRGPLVRPSRAAHYPAKRMSDKEVEKFLKLIDEEGIGAVFDPGNLVTSDDVLFRRPLVVTTAVWCPPFLGPLLPDGFVLWNLVQEVVDSAFAINLMATGRAVSTPSPSLARAPRRRRHSCTTP